MWVMPPARARFMHAAVTAKIAARERVRNAKAIAASTDVSDPVGWLDAGIADPVVAMSGRILLDGRPIDDLPPERRRVGLMMQDDLLFPHLTVAANIGFGLPAGLDRAARRDRIAAALAEAGLDGLGGRHPATLSGGQRARVALMRMLAADPRAVLMDEPFARLDRPLAARLRALVFDRLRRRGVPALIVTHDPDEAAEAGGPILHLHPPDGEFS